MYKPPHFIKFYQNIVYKSKYLQYNDMKYFFKITFRLEVHDISDVLSEFKPAFWLPGNSPFPDWRRILHTEKENAKQDYVLSLNGWHALFCNTNIRHDVTITTHAMKRQFL